MFENFDWESRMDIWSEATSQQNRGRVSVIWSAYELGEPTDATPWPQARRVRYQRPGFDVRAPIQGDTLLDLYEAAAQTIRKSGDEHHIFIEAFQLSGDELVLQTGS